MLCFESAKFCLRVTQHSQSKFRWKSKFHWKIRPTYVHCTYIGILKKECRKKMGSLLVHMQLQNSLGFVMVYLRFPPTLSVQTAICITIPIDIHRCQLIGKVIPISGYLLFALQAVWVLKIKVFGQKSIVIKWNYQILYLYPVTVRQKLGMILVIKLFKNWH